MIFSVHSVYLFLLYFILSFQAAADKLLEEGLHTYVEQLDVTSADSCAAFAANVAAKYKGIDCLINNAGQVGLSVDMAYMSVLAFLLAISQGRCF